VPLLRCCVDRLKVDLYFFFVSCNFLACVFLQLYYTCISTVCISTMYGINDILTFQLEAVSIYIMARGFSDKQINMTFNMFVSQTFPLSHFPCHVLTGTNLQHAFRAPTGQLYWPTPPLRSVSGISK
jgi:hypothetical protein